ncbi:MAG: class I adenylate-forming enzyme family protein [Verrucomicrobiota bacterium JB024]|nr:class I adenylate-forming enzyme family protein [Verrucomicrobiota bacterium JB024]
MSSEVKMGPLLWAWETLCCREGERTAVTMAATGSTVTFAALDELARQWESRLSAHALCRRAVTLRLPNGADWLAAFVALRRLGAVVAPLDAGAPAVELTTANRLLGAVLQVTGEGVAKLSGVRRWRPGLALVKLTSGSTGAPKPIPFSEAELCADATNILATMGFDARDTNFALLPFAHSYALGNLVVPLLAHGVPLAVGSGAFPHVIAEEVACTGATVLPTVPAVLEGLARVGGLSLKPLRLVISAAAPLSPELARRFREATGLPVHNFYGSSETGGIAYDRDGQAGLSGESVGTAMAGVQLERTQGGRLRVTSAAVSGYGRPRRGDGGASRTLADRVDFTATGGLVVCGRADRIVKCAGVRLDLARVEQVAANEAGVGQVVTFYEPTGERVFVAYSGPSSVAEVAQILKTAFPRLGRRLHVRQLEVLPLTGRGKIDHRTLRRTLLG